MFICEKLIYLNDTDATGVLFFTSVQKLALQVFEDFLIQSNRSLRDILLHEQFLFPIVHVEADYMEPMRVGDRVKVYLKVDRIGNSSFCLSYDFFLAQHMIKAAKVSIVHVGIDRETKKAAPLPSAFVLILRDCL